MKKVIILLIVLFAGINGICQLTDTGSNVGVGVQAPLAQLDVNNEIFIRANSSAWEYDTGKGLYIRYSTNGSQDAAYIQSFDRSNNNTPYPMKFYSSNFSFIGGWVGIGTASPDAALAVNGTIHTKEVKVDNSNWPDYVFHSGYQLPSLSEVRTFIKEKHHLPDVPSASEVEENGLYIGEMNALLMKKIEELTLYTLNQQAEIDALKKQLYTIQDELSNKK